MAAGALAATATSTGGRLPSSDEGCGGGHIGNGNGHGNGKHRQEAVINGRDAEI